MKEPDYTEAKKIRQLISAWSRALEAKDAAAMMEHYLPDAVLYDAVPPYKTVGRENIQKIWQWCLPHFPEKFRSEHAELEVEVSGEVAYAYGLHHFVPEPPDHRCGETWMRVSLGFRKVGEDWKLAHEHVSIPFNPMTELSWKISDPTDLSSPDYGGCQPCEAEA